MEISWTYCVKNEEVWQSVQEERKILHAIKRKKVKWIGHIRHRNCLLIHVKKGKVTLKQAYVALRGPGG
jgi:hypothetical protein